MMLGCMKLLGMQINYANAFVATMIMGVGIDYAIHLVHRLHANGGVARRRRHRDRQGRGARRGHERRRLRDARVRQLPGDAQRRHRGLIGSLTCLLTALTLVPALMARAPARPKETP